jgi:peptidoglycan/LPS O-acetylase OafA/YrhL
VESKRLFASGVSPRVRPGPATITSHYGFFVPGPISALSLLVALACVFGYRRARAQVAARVAVGALALIALVSFVVPAATALFCWRYQIIQISLLPVAAAIALTAITGTDDDGDAARPQPEGADAAG